jgi:glycosyltransferase involved in cell wall biosynthesis
MKKTRVLAYCDSPTCATGFGTVSRNIFEALYRTGRYEIDILGINYWGDPHEFPYRIWPTGTNPERDPYGRKKCVNIMANRDDYDILFLLQDTFIMDFIPELITHIKNAARPSRSICYFPVDGVPKAEWIKNVSYPDRSFAYSEFGSAEAMKAYPKIGEVGVVPHGVNLNDYHPVEEDTVRKFRSQYFGSFSDKFIFTNLNRNQQRKDIPRTIQAFSEFRKQVPESILYLHMSKKDQGWDLDEVCRAYGFSTSEDVIFPENFGPNQGYPREVVNMLYNSSDCVVSTCLGEGWGLSWIEAMATKTPVIMPGNTAMVENITEERGYLSKSGTNSSLFTVLPHDNEIIRPLVDVDDMVEKMLAVYNNREEAARRAENAYKWIKEELDWQGKVGQMWVDIFDEEVKKIASGFKDDPSERLAALSDKTISAEMF